MKHVLDALEAFATHQAKKGRDSRDLSDAYELISDYMRACGAAASCAREADDLMQRMRKTIATDDGIRTLYWRYHRPIRG